MLHVVDASDPLRDERIVQVREVLAGIGAGSIRELKVFNKIDLMGVGGAAHRAWRARTACPPRPGSRRRAARDSSSCARPSAQAVRPNQVRRTLHLDMLAAALRSDLYRREAVRAERQCDDGSWELDVELDPSEMAKILGSRGVAAGGATRGRPQAARRLTIRTRREGRALVGERSAARMPGCLNRDSTSAN